MRRGAGIVVNRCKGPPTSLQHIGTPLESGTTGRFHGIGVLELATSALVAYFLFNGVLYSMCVHYRPRAPLPEKGRISPVTTKFGTCYTSEFESLMRRHFFAVSIPTFMVAFVLQLTYRRSWIPSRSIGDNLKDQRASRDQDLNFRRMVVFFVIEALILCSFWHWM